MAAQRVHEMEKPNGPVAAVFLAGGIGSAVIGIATILAEASEGVGPALNWWNPAGPLTGKTGLGVIAFLVSWVVLHVVFRGRNVNFAGVTTAAFILLAIGLLGTFPPFFTLFAAE